MRAALLKWIAFPCALFAGFLAAQTTSPFVGEWTLNTAKSKSDQPMGDAILRIRASDKGFEITFQRIRPAGNPSPRTLPCILDGKEHPFAFPDAKHNSHTASCRLIDRRTMERTINHDKGKLVTTTVMTVAMDGEIMEEVSTDTAEDGKVVKSLYVFDKK